MRKIISTIAITAGLLLTGAPAIGDGVPPACGTQPDGTIIDCPVPTWDPLTFYQDLAAREAQTIDAQNLRIDRLIVRTIRQRDRIQHQRHMIRRLRAELAAATS